MSTHDYNTILTEINTVRYELKSLEGKLDDLEKDIRKEVEHSINKVEWAHQDYDRRISFTEKILFGAVGIILVSVLGALLASIIR